jgi:tetratricopeptide (TPR) repeat protein
MVVARSSWFVGLTLFTATVAPAGASNTPSDFDVRVAAVYQAAYDLDQDLAVDRARALVRSAPGESRAHRALAAAVWLDIIFRRGTVTVDHYVGGLGGPPRTLPKPPAALDAEFRQAITRAIDLAAERVRSQPDDVEARFDLGTAYALQASYLASVDGSMTAAFGSARRAFDTQEDVLARDPSKTAASVVVGTYRYMVAGMALPTRMVAYLAGFGGGKERGISMLETAAREAASRVEAMTSLVLIYSREGRHADAYRVLSELAAAFPRNRVFVLEQASAAIRAGKHAEADALLSSGLMALDRDPRPRMPGERALWLYKRGLARFGRDRRAEAARDFEAALAAGPPAWVRGRALVTLGKIADLSGRRDQAVANYRTAREVGTAARDHAGAAEATRLLRQPYTRPRG